uniref:Uncharacterized protein n=1 Tax=viral metagenome TaxID=1070528 RepID=A0A6C0I4J3_9ZZZZ
MATTTLPREFYPATEEAILAAGGRSVPIIKYKFNEFKRQAKANEVLIMLLDTGLFKKTAYVVTDENRYAVHMRGLNNGYVVSCHYYFVPKDNIMTQVTSSIIDNLATTATVLHVATDA